MGRLVPGARDRPLSSAPRDRLPASIDAVEGSRSPVEETDHEAIGVRRRADERHPRRFRG